MSDIPDMPEAALGPPGTLVLAPDDMAIYVLNAGDGDALVLQFPEEGGRRAYAVVDSNDGTKTLSMLDTLQAAEAAATRSLAFVCATHPHLDHIRGLREVLRRFSGRVSEYWDSGFRYTSNTFFSLIEEVEAQRIRFVRPTSGYETFINGAKLTVLSPSIYLRNRYDSYGIDPNNGSVVIKVEYPAQTPISDVRRSEAEAAAAAGAPIPKARSAILGGDAQTDAWSKVLEDFPHLHKVDENWAKLIKAAGGRQPLLCDVLKVSHHASKHGVNLELVERMGDSSGSGISQGPKYMINSCGENSTHGFPHAVAQEIMREVRFPTSKASNSPPASRPVRDLDHDLGILYTPQQVVDAAGNRSAAGSVAVVLHRDASPVDVYRLGDRREEPVFLAKARRVT